MVGDMAQTAVATVAHVGSNLALPALSLTKKQIGKGYFDAWTLVRELQEQPSDAVLDEFTQRVINYLGYRFNLIYTKGTCFAPKPWVSSRRECWDCEGAGTYGSRGYNPETITAELCRLCRTQGWIGARQDFERAL